MLNKMIGIDRLEKFHKKTRSAQSRYRRLVGTSQDMIIKEVSRLLDDPEHYTKMSRAHNPYGDGQACKRIIQALTLL